MQKTDTSPAEKRFDRIAWLYDWMESPMEKMASGGCGGLILYIMRVQDFRERIETPYQGCSSC